MKKVCVQHQLIELKAKRDVKDIQKNVQKIIIYVVCKEEIVL